MVLIVPAKPGAGGIGAAVVTGSGGGGAGATLLGGAGLAGASAGEASGGEASVVGTAEEVGADDVITAAEGVCAGEPVSPEVGVADTELPVPGGGEVELAEHAASSTTTAPISAALPLEHCRPVTSPPWHGRQ